MTTVFVVQHVSASEDIKFIGVYRSFEAARAAIERLSAQPGFREHPRLIDPLKDEEEAGFYIGEYELDKDHWSEGFVTA
jgi:hypothetical protein